MGVSHTITLGGAAHTTFLNLKKKRLYCYLFKVYLSKTLDYLLQLKHAKMQHIAHPTVQHLTKTKADLFHLIIIRFYLHSERFGENELYPNIRNDKLNKSL